MFGPLAFQQAQCQPDRLANETKCLLCEDSFNLRLRLDIFAMHALDVHRCVIDDVQNIKNLPEYILYWRNRFKERPIDEIIPSVQRGSSKKPYFFLSTLLEEDKALRHRLALEFAMKVHEFERTDSNYKRICLYCKYQHEGTRQGYLEHLSEEHNLQLGNPHNLVFIDELIELVESKMRALSCLFCKGTFPDRAVLKEHMRKKLHKRIDPEDEQYDKFYIINYLEVDKNWRVLQYEQDRFALQGGCEENDDQEYSDWTESSDEVTCLFCRHAETDIEALLAHMTTEHCFDFAESTKELDFYGKIKLINYTRKMIHSNSCPYCAEDLHDFAGLQAHLVEVGHCKMPPFEEFNQTEYYFPTYENDALLYLIGDIEET